MTATISMRRHYDLYLTNTKDNSHAAGPYDLVTPTRPSFRGTPRQILAEIQEFARVSGGCHYSATASDPRTGEPVPVEAILDAVNHAEWVAYDRGNA